MQPDTPIRKSALKSGPGGSPPSKTARTGEETDMDMGGADVQVSSPGDVAPVPLLFPRLLVSDAAFVDVFVR